MLEHSRPMSVKRLPMLEQCWNILEHRLSNHKPALFQHLIAWFPRGVISFHSRWRRSANMARYVNFMLFKCKLGHLHTEYCTLKTLWLLVVYRLRVILLCENLFYNFSLFLGVEKYWSCWRSTEAKISVQKQRDWRTFMGLFRQGKAGCREY
jgi:hypothetical protein